MTRFHRILGLTVLAAGLVLAGSWAAYGQTGDCSATLPGCLDPSFGVNGRVTAPAGMDIAALAIQNITVGSATQARIVAVGTVSIVTRRKTTRNWMIARYLPDGTLDTAFGSGGIVQTAFPYGSGTAHAVVVQPDSKLLVAGEGYLLKSFQSAPMGVPVVARYLADGALDTAFGTNGMVGVPYLKHPGSVSGIALQTSDGKIVATTCYIYTCRMGVFRLNLNGALDTSFSGDGIYVHEAVQSTGNAVAVQTIGGQERIVVAGYMVGPQGYAMGTLWRFTPTGTLDTSFGGPGSSGWLMEDFSGYASYYNAMAVDSASQTIVATGEADGFPVGDDGYRVPLARYLADGVLDSSFGLGGKVLPAAELGYGDVAYAIAIQPDGRILLSGSSVTPGSPGWWYAANWRFIASGSPDASFGVNGWVTTDLGSRVQIFYALVQQSDGKFVAAGGGVLARYYQ